MKKIFIVCFTMLMMFCISSCSSKNEVVYMGVNAEILEISKELKGMVVKGLDRDSILGEKCYINCEGEDTYFIFVDNNTHEITDLTFEDLSVGDKITVDINKVENKSTITSRIQLLEKRK